MAKALQGLSANDPLFGLEFEDSDPALDKEIQLLMQGAQKEQKALDKQTRQIEKDVQNYMVHVDHISAMFTVAVGLEITDAELEKELAELEEEVNEQEPKDKKLTKEEEELAELEKELERLEAQEAQEKQKKF